MDIEKLIFCVKKYPILYDVDHCNYKSTKQKDLIWDEIGEELQENAGELKKKWKSLRDCYARYIRSWDPTTVHTAPYTTRYYKFWPWAKHMEIFRPYLKWAQDHQHHIKTVFSDIIDPDPTNTTIQPNTSFELFEQEEKTNDNISQPHRKSRKIQLKKRKRKIQSNSKSSVDKVIKFLKEERSNLAKNSNKLNATEHMFLGFAKTIETFSPRRQASVKMRIANMVFEEELFNKEEQVENKYEFQSTANVAHENDEDQKFLSTDM